MIEQFINSLTVQPVKSFFNIISKGLELGINHNKEIGYITISLITLALIIELILYLTTPTTPFSWTQENIKP